MRGVIPRCGRTQSRRERTRAEGVACKLSRMLRRRGGTTLARCVATILAIVVAASGVRLPLGARGDERFPCESCLCGCVSAIECWSNCCCHTPEERARWALANGVMVPSWDARGREAAATIAATLAADDIDIAELAPCCRERVLGNVESDSCNVDSCKPKQKLGRALVAFVCLERAPASAALRLLPLGVAAACEPTSPESVTIEPARPPPRA
jgi:hypothetical protein